jgi:hypothetical protein
MIAGKLVMFVAVIVSFTGCSLTKQADGGDVTLFSYHIGNSLTAQFVRSFPQTSWAPNGPAIELIAQQKGLEWQYGIDLAAGAPLRFHWQNPEAGNTHEPFEHFTAALPAHNWDVITLQPHNSTLAGQDRDGNEVGDIAVAAQMIELTLQNPANRDARVYIYSSWVKRPKHRNEEGRIVKVDPVDFEAAWLAKNDPPRCFTKEYFEALVDSLNKLHDDRLGQLEHPVMLIPVGDVMLALDRRLKAEAMDDLNPQTERVDINDAYDGGIHLNPIGQVIIATTWYATLFAESPVGLELGALLDGTGLFLSDEQMHIIQETAWEVVRSHRLTGVLAE